MYLVSGLVLSGLVLRFFYLASIVLLATKFFLVIFFVYMLDSDGDRKIS